MSKWFTIGIDPGNTGAIAFYDGEKLTLNDMPVVSVVRNSKTKNRVDAALVANIIRPFATQVKHAYVELVNAMPSQGVSSVFTFGRGAGILEGVLAGLQIPYTLVTPQRWQKHQGVAKGKDASRARAAMLFPKNADDFKRKKDDGRADAALIARYGSQQDS